MLPTNIRETLLKVGKVEWCVMEPSTPEQLAETFQRMIEHTHTVHGLEGLQELQYVSTPDGLSIAMVGTSPNSPNVASLIAGLWNWAHEAALLDQA